MKSLCKHKITLHIHNVWTIFQNLGFTNIVAIKSRLITNSDKS